MNVALWIVAALLSVSYLLGGIYKLVTPKEQIAAGPASFRWVEDFSANGVKAIATAEILAALGLVLPRLTGIASVLVPLAAAGLVLLMLGAALTRIRRREPGFMVVDLLFVALAAFVAVGRF